MRLCPRSGYQPLLVMDLQSPLLIHICSLIIQSIPECFRRNRDNTILKSSFHYHNMEIHGRSPFCRIFLMSFIIQNSWKVKTLITYFISNYDHWKLFWKDWSTHMPFKEHYFRLIFICILKLRILHEGHRRLF